MYLASKFEEIVPPEISEFVYITDDTYTKSQIVRMERMILKVLDFNLAAPTAHNFLLRYLKASEAEQLNLEKGVQGELSSSSLAGNSTSGALSSQTIIQHLSMVCHGDCPCCQVLKCICDFIFSICVSWLSKMLIHTSSISLQL